MDKNVKWNYYKLDSVAKLVSGRTPEREQKEYYADEGTPWVKIENLDQGYITEAAEYLSELGREKVNLVPENSVLFSIVGTVGKVGIAGRELAANQQIVALIFDESRVLPLYGYYFLRLHAGEIRKLSNQTTMALISRKTLGQYRICVPDSLDMQREIVEKLQKFQAYVDRKEYLRARMENYERLLFEKIFRREMKYHEKMSVREVLSETTASGIPKNEEPDGESGGEFPCIRSGEFVHTYLDEDVYGRWKNDGDRALSADSAYQVREGDILLRNGRLLLMEKVEFPIYYERNILRIRARRDQLLPEVLYAYLNLPQIRRGLYAEKKAGDSRKRPIRASELERMEIPYFTMEKQKEFAEGLRKLRGILRSVDREIRYARKALEIACGNLLSGRELDGRKMCGEQEESAVECAAVVQESAVECAAVQKSAVECAAAVQESAVECAAAVQESAVECAAVVQGSAVECAAAVQESAVECAAAVQESAGKYAAARPEDTKAYAGDAQESAEGGADAVCRLILAVLCGWSPLDERTGAYCSKRQEIFRKAQPFFQPAAFSLVTRHGQEEYLLERDFFAYHSPAFCRTERTPLDCLREMLRRKAEGDILDAHLAFQGENGICTDADWESGTVKTMAREGMILLGEYSGFAECASLFI